MKGWHPVLLAQGLFREVCSADEVSSLTYVFVRTGTINIRLYNLSTWNVSSLSLGAILKQIQEVMEQEVQYVCQDPPDRVAAI